MKKSVIVLSLSIFASGLFSSEIAVAGEKKVTVKKTSTVTIPTTKTIRPKKPDLGF
ncbi:hypothetical protein KUL42_09760 [Alteromonas sp. KUL42]|uniref:hypothetical protein n=1 Tax=Alteromonas sp. KUL42 TaxID=2480797 RepID=UPI0010FFBAEC|nr:hypothetical protein [Alteromonas sp. KUL42]GEA06215.1 hypothetical protein KUL42_09760 [Alteromonas sp. KUL42]